MWAERGLEPSSATVLAVADHISFAIKRARQAIEVDYPLRAEIAHLYPRELAWGERIVTTLNQRLDVQLPSEDVSRPACIAPGQRGFQYRESDAHVSDDRGFLADLRRDRAGL